MVQARRRPSSTQARRRSDRFMSFAAGLSQIVAARRAERASHEEWAKQWAELKAQTLDQSVDLFKQRCTREAESQRCVFTMSFEELVLAIKVFPELILMGSLTVAEVLQKLFPPFLARIGSLGFDACFVESGIPWHVTVHWKVDQAGSDVDRNDEVERAEAMEVEGEEEAVQGEEEDAAEWSSVRDAHTSVSRVRRGRGIKINGRERKRRKQARARAIALEEVVPEPESHAGSRRRVTLSVTRECNLVRGENDFVVHARAFKAPETRALWRHDGRHPTIQLRLVRHPEWGAAVWQAIEHVRAGNNDLVFACGSARHASVACALLTEALLPEFVDCIPRVKFARKRWQHVGCQSCRFYVCARVLQAGREAVMTAMRDRGDP